MKLSFVVIGLNEGKHLFDCIRSIREADLEGIPFEIIYVDGGSSDDSVRIAHALSCDVVIPAEGVRKAAINRNIGVKAAQGEYVQFLDGDMKIETNWPKHALDFLSHSTEVAAVTGKLKELRSSYWYRVLELDWISEVGDVAFCGGAAMFRREVILLAGGFPEDVSVGEEPLLCWKIRNVYKKRIVQLNYVMAYHDLAFRGFWDYWRRCLRSGKGYAEVSRICRKSSDRLWWRDYKRNYHWFLAILLGFVAFLILPNVYRLIIVGVFFLLVVRKTIQTRKKSTDWHVAMGYALHTYFAKIPLGIGQLISDIRTFCFWLKKRFVVKEKLS